jgi:hypothetical protein
LNITPSPRHQAAEGDVRPLRRLGSAGGGGRGWGGGEAWVAYDDCDARPPRDGGATVSAAIALPRRDRRRRGRRVVARVDPQGRIVLDGKADNARDVPRRGRILASPPRDADDPRADEAEAVLLLLLLLLGGGTIPPPFFLAPSMPRRGAYDDDDGDDEHL